MWTSILPLILRYYDCILGLLTMWYFFNFFFLFYEEFFFKDLENTVTFCCDEVKELNVVVTGILKSLTTTTTTTTTETVTPPEYITTPLPVTTPLTGVCQINM